MKPHPHKVLKFICCALAWMPMFASAQIISGSNGSDGALNPTTNIVIDMSDHPTGVYQYTSVNIPNGVTVSFIPNANNSPLTWLVLSNVNIDGFVDVSGHTASSFPQIVGPGGQGGPGGYRGGDGGVAGGPGRGPGGGSSGTQGFGASYGTQAAETNAPPKYGNDFLLPLLGGSGGGGSSIAGGPGGGGGGAAILIVASRNISINGNLSAAGGQGGFQSFVGTAGGGGSGGGVRLVASSLSGSGTIGTSGGLGTGNSVFGGQGRVRFDTFENNFSGSISGTFTQGSQFIIAPTAGQLPQLTVTSVGGVPVSPSPTGALSTPDAVLSAQQNNPIPIVVNCANLPLHTSITVSVKPMSGLPVSATGYNDSGNVASSTATVSLLIPRGGGLVYATATSSN